MNYIDFYTTFKKKSIFSFQEILFMYPNFDKRRLFEWKNKWYIQSLLRWWYAFTDKKFGEEEIFYIANIINKPSYISCESALYYYNLIPEWVFLTTSITTKKTIEYQTSIWNFNYNKVLAKLFFGFQLIKWEKWTYKIAYKEKALLDFLYLKPHIKTKKDMLDLRIDRDEFLEKFNQKRRNTYLKQFNKKTLIKRANLLLKLLQSNA